MTILSILKRQLTLTRQPSLHYFYEICIFFFLWSLLTAGSFQNLRHEGVRGYKKELIPIVLKKAEC